MVFVPPFFLRQRRPQGDEPAEAAANDQEPLALARDRHTDFIPHCSI
jgi:hypothetical protein